MAELKEAAKLGIPWDQIIQLGLGFFLNRRGEQTPNTYPVPLTPEDKYWDDQRKKIWESGGTDAQKVVGGAGRQYLSQIPGGPSNFSFMSPHLKGQSFAGGVKIPTFDLSKMTPPPVGPTKPTFPDGQPPFERGDRPERPDRELDVPRGTSDPFADMPSGNADPTQIKSFASWWENFKQDHPNWAQIGVNGIIAAGTAALGYPAAIVGKFLKHILLAGGGQASGSGRGATPTTPTQHGLQNNPPPGGGITVKNGYPIPIGGMPFPGFEPDEGFKPKPIPTLPWDTDTYGGSRQKRYADLFNRNLAGSDIFDENQRRTSGGYAFGGSALI